MAGPSRSPKMLASFSSIRAAYTVSSAHRASSGWRLSELLPNKRAHSSKSRGENKYETVHRAKAGRDAGIRLGPNSMVERAAGNRYRAHHSGRGDAPPGQG